MFVSDSAANGNPFTLPGWTALCNVPKLLLGHTIFIRFNATFKDDVIESSTAISDARVDFATSPAVARSLYLS